jgi:hypothetical protein
VSFHALTGSSARAAFSARTLRAEWMPPRPQQPLRRDAAVA